MIYFDSTFFVRLYIEENGYERIRSLAQHNDVIHSSVLGKMETEAALHRQLREGHIGSVGFQQAHAQFAQDTRDHLLKWLPLTTDVIERVHQTFLDLPPNIFLRTGDAIHLATAVEAGFKEIYSNDRHLLGAAPRFKLKGINPLAK